MSRNDDDSHAETLAANVTVDDTLAASTLGDTTAASAPRSANFVPERELARGGMGRVVIARDQRLDRTVALKLLQRDSPMFRARFEREAAITARLAHPAIVPIYEAGVLSDGEPFYAMKLVEGTPLDATIEKAADLHARLALLPRAMAVCEALAYAHSHRVIHRDLKPANVLVGSFGETVVIDWGLAKDLSQPSTRESFLLAPRADSASDLTIDGDVVGTPSYMPPEQASGGSVDERADVYALGALLYHVVAGRPPYRGRTAGEILAAVEVGPPTPIAEVEPGVPDDLASIIAKAMARAPADRYPTAGALADELRRFIDGRLVASHRYTGAELLRRWLRKHRAAVAVAAVALVVLAAGGALSVHKIMARERETAHALAESRLEQGRQLLLSGDPAQATPFLAAALAELPDDPVARRLGTTALRDAQRRLGVFDGTAAAFRPDGRELAIGRSDGAIDVVDPSTGAKLRALPHVDGAIATLDYAPDGAQLAVATDRGAFLIDAGSGAHVATLATARASEIRFVPPRGELVAILHPTAVSLVARDGTLVASDIGAVRPHDLELARDGSMIAAICTGASIAWSVPDLARAITAPDNGTTRYSVVVDHHVLFTAGIDGVRRWGTDPAQLATGASVTLERFADGSLLTDGRTLAGDGTSHVFSHVPIQVAAVVDAAHAITGGYDRTLRVWDLARTHAPAIVLDAEAATSVIVVDPAGTRAVSRGEAADARIELWDVSRPPAPAKTVALGARVDAIMSDRRDRIAVRSGGVTHLFSAGLEPIATVPGWPVAFRPSRDELVTDVDGRLELFSAQTGARIREIADQPEMWHVAVSPNAGAIATASASHVALRDADWKIIASFDSADPIGAIAVADDGRVISGHASGAIRIWDARTGRVLVTAGGHTANVARLELRGDTLVSDSWDLTTRRWAFPSGRALGIVKRFARMQDTIAVAPDDDILATAQETGMVLLWDTAQGRLVDQLSTSDALAAVAFVDERHVIAGGDGGHLELFELSMPRSTANILELARQGQRWRLDKGRAVENY